MPIMSLKCSHCGSELTFDEEKIINNETTICRHCGEKLLIKDKAIIQNTAIKSKKWSKTNIVIQMINCLSAIVLVFALSVLIGINLRFIYYIDVEIFNLPWEARMTRGEIYSVYNQLVNFLHPFYFKSFPITDPGLVSASSIKHFEDVKLIFNVIWGAGLFGILGLIGGNYANYKTGLKNYYYLKLTAYFYYIIVGILLFFIVFFFNDTFIVFHKILFWNNDWLFSDAIIEILPAEFFMQMGIAIGVIIIAYSVLLHLSHHFLRQRAKQKI